MEVYRFNLRFKHLRFTIENIVLQNAGQIRIEK